MKKEGCRFTVELLKMTTPNGSKRTVAAICMNTAFQLESSLINSVLPIIEKEYQNMLVKAKETKNILKAVDEFLYKTSDKAIVGFGLAKMISEDLEISLKETFELLLKTTYINFLIKKIGREYRKVKKDHPISYAESCQQLVDIFGFSNAIRILHINGINMKKSTLQYLYNVSKMSPKIKKMIIEGEIPLTVAFMIPQVEEEKQVEIANKVKNMKFSEARKVIMHIY